MTDDTKKDDMFQRAKALAYRVSWDHDVGVLNALVQRVEEAEARIAAMNYGDDLLLKLLAEKGVNCDAISSGINGLITEIESLKAEIERLEKLLRSIENLDEKADKASWIEQCEDARKLAIEWSRQADALKAENARFLADIQRLTSADAIERCKAHSAFYNQMMNLPCPKCEEKDKAISDLKVFKDCLARDCKSLEDDREYNAGIARERGEALSAARKALERIAGLTVSQFSGLNQLAETQRRLAEEALAADSGAADRLVDADKTITDHSVDANKMVATTPEGAHGGKEGDCGGH